MHYVRGHTPPDLDLQETDLITDLEFIKSLPIKDGDSVLDVGCGLGRDLRLLRGLYPNSRLCGVDYNKYQNGDYPGEFFEANVLSLPFKDKEFDVAYANSVFCHLEDDQVPEAIAELERVAKQWFYTEITINGMTYDFVRVGHDNH